VQSVDKHFDALHAVNDASLRVPARAIHGDLEQRDRTRTLDAFRSGAVTTLVATDVAARGLDLPDLGLVVHAEIVHSLPNGHSYSFTLGGADGVPAIRGRATIALVG